MKTEKKTFNKTDYQLKKLGILLFISILIYPGCKLSYDDISLGEHKESPGEIEGFSQNNYGYVIYDIEAGKIVKGHNASEDFTPASVTKVFTALFAVEALGDDYTFTTSLSYIGNISDKILTGDIFLKGSGDPEFSIEGLLSLVSSLKSKKIKEVKGNFFFDESIFPPRESLDRDMPAEAFYNAGMSPLTLNSNIIYAIQRTNSTGQITGADLLPTLPSFKSYIYNDNLPYPFLKFHYSEGRETWGLPDKYLWDSRQQLPVKHPGLYAAQTFQKLCEIHGIKLPAPKSGITDSSSKIIAEYTSRPLTAILRNMLFTSNNMTAELIYNASSALYDKDANSNSKKTSAMEDFFSKNFTSIKWNNFKIANASGLTNINKTTPEQTAAVLLFIEKTDKDNFRLEEILPLSGWDGTMKGRLDEPEAAFRVYCKTGSIFYASGLAGIFYGKSGKRYIFTIYINDTAKRSEYDAKKDKTADDLNKGGFWTKKAAASIDEFLIKMILQL